MTTITRTTGCCGGGGGPVECGDCALGDLSNVDTSGASEGDVLTLESGEWVPAPAPGAAFACDDLDACTLNALGDVNAPAPNDGDVLTWDTDEWVASPPSGGGVTFAQTVVASDVAANSATWADMTGYEVEIAAAEGDLIDLFLCTYPNAFAANAQVCLDIATIVSAAPVNRISGGTGDADLGCVESFQVQGSGQALYGDHIGRKYVVAAEDIDGGTVTFRGQYRNPVASCTLSAAAGIRSCIQATNLGPTA